MDEADDDAEEDIGIQGEEQKEVKKQYDQSKKQGRGHYKNNQEGNLEEKKNFPQPGPRQKTERGDYVVTSINIQDRGARKEHHVS